MVVFTRDRDLVKCDEIILNGIVLHKKLCMFNVVQTLRQKSFFFEFSMFYFYTNR